MQKAAYAAPPRELSLGIWHITTPLQAPPLAASPVTCIISTKHGRLAPFGTTRFRQAAISAPR
jgi:hypothetical protein